MRVGAFLILFALLLAAAPREPWSAELRAQVATARSLIARGSLDIAFDGPNEHTDVRDGRRYARLPPGLAIALVPIELAARGLDHLTGTIRSAPLLESATSAGLVALACVVLLTALRRAAVRPSIALTATAALALSTSLCAAGRIPDGTALATLLLTCAVLAARGPGVRSAFAVGAASGGLVLIEPALFPAGLVLALVIALRRREPVRLLAGLLPLLVGAALVLIHRAHIGYFPDPPGDLTEGLYGLTISTGKSLLLYSPPLVLGVWALPWFWRARRTDAAVTFAVAAAVLLSVAQLHRWHGDPSWGPRRLTPLVPIALWLEASLPPLRRQALAALGVLAVVGALIEGLGAAFAPAAYPHVLAVVREQTGAGGWFPDLDDAHFIPQFSPILGQAWLLDHFLRNDRNLAADAPWKLLQQNTPRLDKELLALHLDWWALGWPRLPAAVLLGVLSALATAGAWLTVRRLRMLR